MSKRPRLWNCNYTGHLVDPDWPVEQPVVRTPDGRHYVFSMARCVRCGGFYSHKQEVEKPSGLVTPEGKRIIE